MKTTSQIGTVAKNVWCSAAGDNFDDFEFVAVMKDAGREFGGGNGFTVVFDNHAAGKKFLGEEKLLEAAGEMGLNLAAVGGD